MEPLSPRSVASTVILRPKHRKRKLIIVKSIETTTSSVLTSSEANNEVTILKPKQRVNKAWLFEKAKSGRSTCKECKQLINKDEYRIGVMTFYPHKNIRWLHFNKCSEKALIGVTMERFWNTKNMTQEEKDILQHTLHDLEAKLQLNLITQQYRIPDINGQLDLPRFMSFMTDRYGKYRSFRFGLPERQMYGKNWRWRCFLSTMLVCNTHETTMLEFTDKLFTVYQTPESFDKLRNDKSTIKAWMDYGTKIDLRHIGKKMQYILKANKNLLENYDGDVPTERKELEKMAGVGRHVASISMAWCYQQAEFGIDVHVKRILTRWGFITDKMDDIQVETIVKQAVPEEKIGHFSRSFVDHGQQICGYTPNCEKCYLRASCPTAAKHLEW